MRHRQTSPNPRLQIASVGDIARPDDHFDQYPAWSVRFRRLTHGLGDLDAKAEE